MQPGRKTVRRGGARFHGVVFTLAAAVAAQQPKAGDAAAFSEGLVGVHEAMARAAWDEADGLLKALIAVHERQPYVLACRDALVQDHARCRFMKKARIPSLEQLVSGRIVRYSEKTGHIEVVYEGGFADWKRAEDEQDVLIHPMVFADSYTVRAEGPRYFEGNVPLRLLFDLDPGGSDWFVADFGVAGHPTSVTHGDADISAPIGAAESFVAADQPFVLELQVSEKLVQLRSSGKTLLTCDRQPARLGCVGMRRHAAQKVTLTGRIEPSWLQRQFDDELSKQRAEFDQTFDAKRELPEWLFTMEPPPRTAALEPGPVPGDDALFSDEADEAIALWLGGKTHEAWEVLRKLTTEDAPPETLSFLEAAMLLETGQVERAMPVAEQLLREAPQSGLARLMHARVLDGGGQVAEAIEGMRAALALDPGNGHLYETLAVALLRQGERDAAVALVRRGKLEHGLFAELASIDLTLAMAERGPSFVRRFQAESEHYVVVSDIDERSCKQACKLLENSYAGLAEQFALPKEQAPERFRVFLFSGQRGYDDYSKAILGQAIPHTAGLYSPVLKQLLIWNLPKREDMERTIVHEGFHQFLDRVMHDPPAWLNEGTAEYWQTARMKSGKLVAGQVRHEHIATLSRTKTGLPGLKKLAYGARADFYNHANVRYAHAWALVHYLRDGPAANRERHRVLLQALRETGSARAAMDRAFAGIDWDEWENGFWEYLRELGKRR